MQQLVCYAMHTGRYARCTRIFEISTPKTQTCGKFCLTSSTLWNFLRCFVLFVPLFLSRKSNMCTSYSYYRFFWIFIHDIGRKYFSTPTDSPNGITLIKLVIMRNAETRRNHDCTFIHERVRYRSSDSVYVRMRTSATTVISFTWKSRIGMRRSQGDIRYG